MAELKRIGGRTMSPFEKRLAKPRSYGWLELVSKIGYVVGLPLLLLSTFPPDPRVRIWGGSIGGVALLLGLAGMFVRDLYLTVAMLLILSSLFVASGTIALSQEKGFSPWLLSFSAPLFVAGIVMLLRWQRARKQPIQLPEPTPLKRRGSS